MKKTALAAILALTSAAALADDVIRHPLPNNSTFPIAQAVETEAHTALHGSHRTRCDFRNFHM